MTPRKRKGKVLVCVSCGLWVPAVAGAGVGMDRMVPSGGTSPNAWDAEASATSFRARTAADCFLSSRCHMRLMSEGNVVDGERLCCQRVDSLPLPLQKRENVATSRFPSSHIQRWNVGTVCVSSARDDWTLEAYFGVDRSVYE